MRSTASKPAVRARPRPQAQVSERGLLGAGDLHRRHHSWTSWSTYQPRIQVVIVKGKISGAYEAAQSVGRLEQRKRLVEDSVDTDEVSPGQANLHIEAQHSIEPFARVPYDKDEIGDDDGEDIKMASPDVKVGESSANVPSLHGVSSPPIRQ